MQLTKVTNNLTVAFGISLSGKKSHISTESTCSINCSYRTVPIYTLLRESRSL